MLTILLFVSLSFAYGANFAETYTMVATFELKKKDGSSLTGNVTEWRDQTSGCAAETEDEIDESTKVTVHKVKVLHYKDANPTEYELDNDTPPCKKSALTGPMPKVWGWLPNATDSGKIDKWTSPTGAVYLCNWLSTSMENKELWAVCVNETKLPDMPLKLYHLKSTGDVLQRNYVSFVPKEPSQDHFVIPKKCL